MTDPNNTPEDSMSPPEDKQPQQIQTIDATCDVDSIMPSIINLNEDNILHEPNCSFCANADREEMEQKWLETKLIDDVKDILKAKGHPTVHRSVIENHMLFHVGGEIKEIQKQEYAGRLSRLNSRNMSTLARLRQSIDAIDERLLGVNSITPGGDLGFADIEKIKSSETSRLMSTKLQYLKLQASLLGEMQSSGELLSVPRNAFITIFQNSLIKAQNDGERELLNTILNKIEELSRIAQ